MKTTYNWLIRL